MPGGGGAWVTTRSSSLSGASCSWRSLRSTSGYGSSDGLTPPLAASEGRQMTTPLQEAAAAVLRARDKTALRDAIGQLDKAYRATLDATPTLDVERLAEALRTNEIFRR